jgi:multiple sugar transport system substrate-binding protein
MLSACSAGNPVVDKAASGKSKLGGEMTFLMQDPGKSADMKALIDKIKEMFGAKYPDSKLTIDLVAAKDYYKHVDELFAKGTPPDVFLIHDVPHVVDKGYARDLAPFFKTDNLKLSDLYPDNVLNLFTMGKKTVAVPVNLDPLAVGYNKAMFMKSGIPGPKDGWTWEEFVDTALKLKAANGDQGEVLFDFNPAYFEILTLARGGQFLSPDGKTSKGYLDSAKAVEAARWASALYNSSEITSLDVEKKGVNAFASGNLSMIVRPISVIEALYSKSKQLVGIATYPYFKGGEHTNSGTIVGMGISASSKNEKLAWEFVKMAAIDVNELTEKMYDMRLAFSLPLANGRRNANDPFNSVRLDGISHMVKAATVQNDMFVQAISPVKQDIANLMQPDVDIPAQLSVIADQVDQQQRELENK